MSLLQGKGHTVRFCKFLQEKLHELKKLKDKPGQEAGKVVENIDEVLASIA